MTHGVSAIARAMMLLPWLAACYPTPHYAPVAAISPPNEAEYAPYLVPGTASVSGQGFLVQRGGATVRAAGREVTLDPATAYAMAWYTSSGYGGDAAIFIQARRTTTADADGRFTFSGLPAGRYIVKTNVTWEVPSQTGTSVQGGMVSRVITVAAGEKKENVILNQTAINPE